MSSVWVICITGYSDHCHRAPFCLLFTQGVYVPADPQFPKHFHGLGMRIEDEVLVGAEHPVVLSASAPKEVWSLPVVQFSALALNARYLLL
jgi:hypothetical protein